MAALNIGAQRVQGPAAWTPRIAACVGWLASLPYASLSKMRPSQDGGSRFGIVLKALAAHDSIIAGAGRGEILVCTQRGYFYPHLL
jgi:hypothetical protein